MHSERPLSDYCSSMMGLPENLERGTAKNQLPYMGVEPCLPVFISCLCIELLFLPLGHKNINFKPGAATSFLQLAGGGGAGRSVHHRDRFRQGVPAERDIPLLVFGGQSPNRQCQTWYSEPTGLSRAFCSYCR